MSSRSSQRSPNRAVRAGGLLAFIGHIDTAIAVYDLQTLLGMSEPLSLVFELAHTDTLEDPYGFRFKPQNYTLRIQGGHKRVHLAWSSEVLDDLDALHASSCDPAIVRRVGRASHDSHSARISDGPA